MSTFDSPALEQLITPLEDPENMHVVCFFNKYPFLFPFTHHLSVPNKIELR